VLFSFAFSEFFQQVRLGGFELLQPLLQVLVCCLQLLVARLRLAQLAANFAPLRFEVLLRQFRRLRGGFKADDLGLQAGHIGLQRRVLLLALGYLELVLLEQLLRFPVSEERKRFNISKIR